MAGSFFFKSNLLPGRCPICFPFNRAVSIPSRVRCRRSSTSFCACSNAIRIVFPPVFGNNYLKGIIYRITASHDVTPLKCIFSKNEFYSYSRRIISFFVETVDTPILKKRIYHYQIQWCKDKEFSRERSQEPPDR